MEISLYDKSLKYKILQENWGFGSFRDLQEPIIDSILSGKDTLALLPTGGGKSLCYQLPALMKEGVCLVVSPLLALMKDQVEQLQNLGIQADFLSSDLDILQEEEVFSNCKNGATKLLYISPERLSNQEFLKNIEQIDFSFLVVDEAHCISEWGQDFRPSYKNIKTFRERFNHLPCLALTATATPKVLEEIISLLKMEKFSLFRKEIKRENININVLKIEDKYSSILEFLKYNKFSGLIYVSTRKDAEQLYQFVKNNGNYAVDFFHAGLSKEQKKHKQEWWKNSTGNVLIATNAFGMGIDKSDVRFVIHFSPPATIENYYQEIGRAGRDGRPSTAYLLWNERDFERKDGLLQSKFLTKKEFQKIISEIYSYYFIADMDSVDREFSLDLSQMSKVLGEKPQRIKVVLEFMNHHGLIFFRDKKTKSSIELLLPHNEIDSLPYSEGYFLELLLRNIVGFTYGKVKFDEFYLAEKLRISREILKEKIEEMQRKNYVVYNDGQQYGIFFIKERNQRSLEGEYWALFNQIQKNQIRKWEEMKFFITDEVFCKELLILNYFGHHQSGEKCGRCSSCRSGKNDVSQEKLEQRILNILDGNSAGLEQICILLKNFDKEKVQDCLSVLLNDGKIKMLNYKTYTKV